MERQSSSMLIIGGGSDLGQALAVAASNAGITVLIAARQPPFSMGASVSSFHTFDVKEIDQHPAFLDSLPFLPDMVVCMVGLIGDQRLAERQFSEADLVIRTNFLGPVSMLGEVAIRMERRGHGAIIGVSSVAGDRGRAENYYYGAAKAGFTAFLSGLRQRLGGSPIRVVTIKPGRLHTKMTEGMDFGRFGSLLTATPQQVAPSLLRACLRSRGTVYVPWFWRPIMALVRAIPEPLFRRVKRR